MARHSETEEPYLVFENGMIERAESMLDLIPEQFELVMQNAQKSGLWIRPLEMFYGYKEMDGRYVRRFDSHGW